MPTIITIGSALVDIFVRSRDFTIQSSEAGVFLCQKYGEKVELDGFELHTGGGGGNTAVGFKRLGFAAAVVAETGRDVWAQFVIDELEKAKVSTDLLIKERKEETGGSIILTGTDGGRTVMVHRGAASLLDPQDIPHQPLLTADWVHLSNIGGRFMTLQTIFALVRQAKVGLSWNPGKAELALLQSGQLPVTELGCNILLMNDTEWQSIAAVQASLLAQIPYIVITKGKNGGEVYLRGKLEHRYQAAPVHTIEETGAGDAFAVGFVGAYLHGQELIQACEWGSKNAASVVQQIGAKNGLLQLQQLAKS